MGDAQTIELRRCLQSWSDAPTGGDYNQNATNAPTWRDHTHPNGRWNVPGAGALGGTGASASDYNGVYDLASRVDATNTVQAVNEWVTFSGQHITEAFRFWFDNPSLDYGYALRLNTTASQEMKFERWEAGLQEHGPVLTLTYALPVTSLKIVKVGDEMTLSWPITPAGFAVESASDPSPTAVWSLVTGTATSTNGQNQISIISSGGQMFFRLKR
jgi:hypothetical protein